MRVSTVNAGRAQVEGGWLRPEPAQHATIGRALIPGVAPSGLGGRHSGAVVLVILLVVLVLLLRRRYRQRRIARIWQQHITGSSEAAPAFVDARRPLTAGFLDAPSVQ